MKKCNILQIIANMDMGGSQIFLMNVFRNIDREKYNLVFLCHGKEEFVFEKEIVDLGGKIIRINTIKEDGYKKFISNIRKIIVENKIDVVHAHNLFNSVFAMIAAKKENIKIRIAHSHSSKNDIGKSIINKVYCIWAKYKIDKLSNIHMACGEKAAKCLFYNRKKVYIVKNRIDAVKFKYNEEKRKKIRQELNISEKDTVFLHVGRFATVKNHMFLLKVFEKFLTENENAKLVLIGEGELEKEIRAEIKLKKIEKNVMLLGRKNDIYNYYNMADIFLLPSIFEGQPTVLMETQVNGLFAVASDTIDKDVRKTDNILFISLQKEIEYWVQQIKNHKFSREKVDENIIEELNIKKTIEELYAIYTMNEV